MCRQVGHLMMPTNGDTPRYHEDDEWRLDSFSASIRQAVNQ